jgi:cell division protein FtsN
MASRKDFVQKKRSGSSASRNKPKPAPKPKPRASAAPASAPKRRSWKLALYSLIGLAGLVYLLNQLLDVSPKKVQTETITDTATLSKPEPIKPKPKPEPVKPKPPEPKKQESVAVSAEKPKPDSKTVSKKEPVIEEQSTQAQSHYEFYDLLTKTEVTVPEVTAYKSTPRTEKLDKKYLLQAASFKNESDAEKMRAQLILAGLPNVHTNRSEGENGVWFRVRVGPFDNRTEMTKAHNKLAKMRISPMAVGAD